MLRREATTIKLSAEDVFDYDESLEEKRLQQQQEKQLQQQLQQQQQQQQHPSHLNESTIINQPTNPASDFNSSNILQEQLNNTDELLQESRTRSKNERIL